jgi:hypothetical protein
VQASPAATPENLMSCKKCKMKALSGKGGERHLVLSDYDFLNQLALPELDQIRSVEGACDFTPSDERQPLHALKVGMFNDHDTFFGEEGLGIVVDELPVHEAVDSVRCDGLDLALHFFLQRVSWMIQERKFKM